MKTTIAAILLTLLCVFTSCKDKKQPMVIIEPEVIIKDTIKSQPAIEIKKETEPIKKKTPRYFLIAGCFEYKGNADRLCLKLQKEGYDTKILPYYENLYLVSYNGYATRSEATLALQNLKKESGKEKTWVYKP